MIIGIILLQSVTLQVFAQLTGTYTAELPPSLSWAKCTTVGGCTTTQGRVILEANYRWVHDYKGYTNCYTPEKWDATLCPDGKTCAANCALEGADYAGTYGVTASGNALTIKYKASMTTFLGARLLLAGSTGYEPFKPLNQEIAFDADVSNLPCGWNGALSLVHMDVDGGMSKFPTNKAGWKYGTGYCDSKCARNQKFINGEGNVKSWTPGNNYFASQGYYGSCCNELSVWEANSMATALTAHPCNTTVTSQTRCEGDFCAGSKTCDAVGCDFNPYHLGNRTYYKGGGTVSTNSKFTVVTQFITNTGTNTGTLKEIRRVYVQNGAVIANAKVNLPGVQPYDSITDGFCSAEASYFGVANTFKDKGGLSSLSQSAASGMVLTISLTKMFDDGRAHPFDTNYIDTSPYPYGPCPYGDIAYPGPIETPYDAMMTVSNLKFGDIGSTYNSRSVSK